MKLKLIILLFFTFIYYTCKEPSPTFSFPIKRFENIFLNEPKSEKNVLIVFSLKDCHACDVLVRNIDRDSILKERIFTQYSCYANTLEYAGFEYLAYALYEFRFPILIIFTPEGNLRGIIGGGRSSKELMALLDSVELRNSFFTNLTNRLYIPDSTYVKMVNFTTKAYLSYLNKDTLQAETAIRESMQQCTYFYNQYLGAKIAQLSGDTLNARRLANRALDINDPFDLFLYQPVRPELCFITGQKDPETKKQQKLVFNNKTYDCGKIKQYERFEFNFDFKNTGTTPVIIQNVEKSCNCMTIRWDQRPVLPGETGSIYIHYDTSKKGVFTKNIFIHIEGEKPTPLYIKGIIV